MLGRIFFLVTDLQSEQFSLPTDWKKICEIVGFISWKVDNAFWYMFVWPQFPHPHTSIRIRATFTHLSYKAYILLMHKLQYKTLGTEKCKTDSATVQSDSGIYKMSKGTLKLICNTEESVCMCVFYFIVHVSLWVSVFVCSLFTCMFRCRRCRWAFCSQSSQHTRELRCCVYVRACVYVCVA